MKISAITASATASAVIARADLAAAFVIASEVAEKRSTVPVLSALRIRADGMGATVSGFDMDTEISVSIAGAVDDRFDLCLSADRFGALLKKAPASEMLALSQPDFPMHKGEPMPADASADFETVRYAVKALSGALMPKLTPGAGGAVFIMGGAELRDALASVSGAISTEETRYYLNGVFFHAQHGEGLAMVATDGHRLYRQKLDAPEGAEGMPGVIIPRNVVRILGKLLKGKECPADVRVHVGADRIGFTFDIPAGRVFIRSKVIDGTFPDYHRVIPTRADIVSEVDGAKMAEAVKAVSTISDRPGAVRFTFGTRGAELDATCPDSGRAETEIATLSHEGAEIEIGLSSAYLLDILAVAGKGTVRIAMTDGGAPIRVTGSREGWDAVQMPMRV